MRKQFKKEKKMEMKKEMLFFEEKKRF